MKSRMWISTSSRPLWSGWLKCLPISLRSVVPYVVEMGLEPINKAVLGLAHILYPTSFA